MKQKLLGIGLLLCMVAPVSITYVWLQQRKSSLKKEVKWRMLRDTDKGELELIKIHKSESDKLAWEHAREFEYLGEMYDVVSRDSIGDSLFFWCWWDSEETRLNQKVKHLLTQAWEEDTPGKESEEKLQHFLKRLYTAQNISWETPIRVVHQLKLPPPQEYSKGRKPQPPSPPPCLGLFLLS